MSRWWIEVDDLVLPASVAGHPALELCNTRAGWGEPHADGQEYLRSYDHLVVAAREAGLLDPERAAMLRAGTSSQVGGRELARARRLRQAAYAALTALAPDQAAPDQAAVDHVGADAAAARARQVLVVADGRATWSWTGGPRAGEPVDAFALVVADLLTSTDAARVRACPGHDCGWLFLDTSGRRRWCQMAVCGNRAKQARLRGQGTA